MKKKFKNFLVLTFFIILLPNYLKAKELVYSCTLDNEIGFAEDIYVLDTKNKSIYWWYQISYGKKKFHEVFLRTDKFNNKIARTYRTLLELLDFAKLYNEQYQMEIIINKEWEKLEDSMGRPLSKKEKIIIMRMSNKLQEYKLYNQINLVTGEWIISTPPLYWDNIPEDLLQLLPPEGRMIESTATYGKCKVLN